MAKHQFQTEVNQLLHLIIHSLYSHKEIFIRELISNASDALDKLKYLTLTDDAYKQLKYEPRIDVAFNEGSADGGATSAEANGQRTFTVSDTGVGMNEQELVENLGTIARSGTRGFISLLSGDAKKDSNLIGQFGVGFYSSFMVADKVEVLTKKAGEEKAYLWTSDGKGEFDIAEAQKDGHGTVVTLYLNDEGSEYANRWSIEDVIRKYSNHIAFPIYLHYLKKEYDDKGKEKKAEPAQDQVNVASALWRRPKSELSDDDYREFYKTVSHDTEDPLFWLHVRAEGTIEYTTLFFVPKQAPFDLYYMDYRPGVKLYVRRVFITDDEKELLPTYLRFVRGVIDSEDLPLNVSREILQQNRVMVNIRTQSVKKILNELARVAAEEKETYKTFIEQFNRPLKEGLYSDFGNRDQLLELVRYKSTKVEGFTSLAEYKERMLPDQKAIYYVSGENEQTLRRSPLIEAYSKKEIEVLIMDDEIDELVLPMIGKYKDVDLKPVNRADAGEDLKDRKDKKKEKEAQPLLDKIKHALGDKVKDVVTSVRLADSPSCIVIDENDPTIKMQAMMKAMGQKEMPDVKPILEINPDHPIVVRLRDIEDETVVADISTLLLDQALILEGVPIKEPADFVQRLNRVMGRTV